MPAAVRLVPVTTRETNDGGERARGRGEWGRGKEGRRGGEGGERGGGAGARGGKKNQDLADKYRISMLLLLVNLVRSTPVSPCVYTATDGQFLFHSPSPAVPKKARTNIRIIPFVNELGVNFNANRTIGRLLTKHTPLHF